MYPELRSSIVCGALNPAVDKRLHVPKLSIGSVQRATMQESTPGGKGLNVSRAAASLGAQVTATGFLGRDNGEWIQTSLYESRIEQDWLYVQGLTRMCLNLIDDSSGISTEILESGPVVKEEEAQEFFGRWEALSTPDEWMTLSGSLPKGLDDSYYAELIAISRSKGANIVLDTSGAALIQGIEAGPHTIKPNEEEFRQWTGADPRNRAAVQQLMSELVLKGVKVLIVSLGKEGCIAATAEGELWRAVPPAINAVNAVGSGDCFVAGWTVANARGFTVAQSLRLATAAGAANAMSSSTGMISMADTAKLSVLTQVERW
ncbi:1-phosphofructokinase family hexose kinase [Paenibacillus herberti]|uniref:Tagatose-6-phosphate kinase n=1 Tax=Paenibacillus herberti TaxID=1619309 RepID=A0A229P3Z4_9BACL|nr:1-phosphofructokinase family hexose kinase [Paenibacillus herberti]OXM16797.1 1-phosphofructokinase [Paenibacillus herberti]